MRLRQSLILVFLVIFLLQLALVEARWCKKQVGQDWECWEEGAPGVPDGSPDFENFCSGEGGTVSATPGQECTQVCCCDNNDEPHGGLPESVSQLFCQGLIDSDPLVWHFILNPDGESCITLCGAGGPPGGGSASVTGLVQDVSDATPVPLSFASVRYEAVGQSPQTVFTATDGTYTIANLEAGDATITASRGDCGAQSQTATLIAGTPTTLDFDLTCVQGDCSQQPVTDTLAAPIAGEPVVSVSWSSRTCDHNGYAIYRSDGCAPGADGWECTGTPIKIGETVDMTFPDTTVAANTGYCYEARVLSAPGNVEVPQALPDGYVANCVHAMSQYCMENELTTVKCFNNDPDLQPIAADGTAIIPFTGAAVCTAQNQVSIVDQCTGIEVCGYYAGQFQCFDPGLCAQCNSIFGWFVDPLVALRFEIGGSQISEQCDEAQFCAYTSQGYASDTYANCADITSCYDYGTKESCELEDNENKDWCHVSSAGCIWVSAYPELGLGVCTPRDDLGEVQCNLCTQLFGECTEELCGLIGDECYFNEYTSSSPVAEQAYDKACLSPGEMACRFYDDEADCHQASGGSPTNVIVNVTYDDPTSLLDATRSGGRHNLLQESDDLNAYRKCEWVVDDQPFCVKNANDWLPEIPVLSDPEDDCLEYWHIKNALGEHDRANAIQAKMIECFRDVEAPVTTLPIAPGGEISLDAFSAIIPSVTDDTFTLAERLLETYFCLDAQGASPACYPNMTFGELAPSEGAYTLRYYSVDAAGNLEEVQRLDFTIQPAEHAYLERATLVEGTA